MKFNVEYIMNNVECLMEVDAADFDTAKKIANQWRVVKLRHTNNTIRITKITPQILVDNGKEIC